MPQTVWATTCPSHTGVPPQPRTSPSTDRNHDSKTKRSASGIPRVCVPVRFENQSVFEVLVMFCDINGDFNEGIPENGFLVISLAGSMLEWSSLHC